MRTLNIRILFKNDEIIVRFESVHLAHEEDYLPKNLKAAILEMFHRTDVEPEATHYAIMMDAFRYSDTTQLDEALKTPTINAIFFKAKIKEGADNEVFKHSTLDYKLPKVPHVALIWLACISYYFNKTGNSKPGNFKAIQFRSDFIENYISSKMWRGKYLSLTLEKYIGTTPHVEQRQSTLLEEILKFKNISQYKLAMTSIDTIYQYYKSNRLSDHPVNFIECLEPEKQLSILLSDKIHDLTNPKTSESDKLNIFFHLARNLIKLNQKAELNYLLANINHHAKKKLYEPCINQPAQDGGKFNWHYTEWQLLCHAKFTLRSDGKMSICNIKKNDGYIKYYFNSNDCARLKDEMEFLGKIVGFEFDPNCDFHEEIVFTKACTEKLKNLGLHLNELYIKKHLLRENNHGLFKNINTVGAKESHKMSFSLFPADIKKVILDEIKEKPLTQSISLVRK